MVRQLACPQTSSEQYEISARHVFSSVKTRNHAGMTMAAFFDLDNTLVRGSSLYHLACELVRKKVIPRREVIRFARQELQYVMRRSEPAGVAASATARALALVAGRSEDAMQVVTAQFVATKLPAMIMDDVLSEVRRFQFHGVPTWIVTASPIELASAIANELGMTGAVGTVSEIHDGRYTGRLASPIAHGPGKMQLVHENAERHGLDLGASWAYSDSINDLPLLSCVGMPVVVNPNSQLLAIAKKNAWGVLETAKRVSPRTNLTRFQTPAAV